MRVHFFQSELASGKNPDLRCSETLMYQFDEESQPGDWIKVCNTDIQSCNTSRCIYNHTKIYKLELQF